MLRSLDLFTGYGGLTLALEPWCKPIAYVEIEEYPQRIIAERMADGNLPRAPILADVKNVTGSTGVCDIIVGGFPCQDISVAGNGEGLGGKRSGLFFEIARLTKEIQPSFVFLENVPAIRTRGLYHVAEEFSSMGYDCRWAVVSASYVGAPHRRERWFFLASAKRDRGWADAEAITRSENERKELQQENGKALSSDAKTICRDVANAKSKGLPSQRESRGLQEKKNSRPSTGIKRGSSSQDWRNRWAIEPNVGRVVNGTPFRLDRIKALGNGVVPAQARLAFKYLMGLKEPVEMGKGESNE